MERHAVEELLATRAPRILALDHYLEARAALVEARSELECAVREFRQPESPASRRRSREVMRRYGDAERTFMSAEIDLHRFHRCLGTGCVQVLVGRLEIARDDRGDIAFTFCVESPRPQAHGRRYVVRRDDWVRVWSPDRVEILFSGTSPVNVAALRPPAEPGDRLPAEFMPSSGYVRHANAFESWFGTKA